MPIRFEKVITKGSINENIAQKDPRRMLIRGIVQLLIYFWWPIFAVLARFDVLPHVFGAPSFVLVWATLIGGWYVVYMCSIQGAILQYRRTLRSNELDTVLLDKLYGHDIEIWTSFCVYVSFLLIGLNVVGMQKFFSSFGACALAFGAAAIGTAFGTYFIAGPIYRRRMFKISGD